MKFKCLLFVLLTAIAFHDVPAIQAQEGPPDFSNKTLREYAKKAAVHVTDVQPSGELVLPVNYFQEAFRKEYKVQTLKADGTPDLDAEAGSLSLTQDDKTVVICTMLAEAMLAVAKPDGQTSGQHLVSWLAAEPKVLDYKTKKGIPLLDVRMKQAWQQFLKEWREKVLAKEESNRFRDALRQAAYSLVRTGLDIEKEHVDRVLAGTATLSGGPGGGGPSTTSAGAGGGRGYHHVDVHHEHLMNGIYRRHDRRMYKIERIQARR